ncbi:MAG: thiamine phosphate synthase [Dehalococcoidia bacterium]|nr:thiamine phosphate synthase [Dehalococcoidia bacterium]
MVTRIPIPCLCLVTDRRLCNSDPEALERRVAGAVRGGVNMVQLREKDLPGGLLLELAVRLRKATNGSALLFVNERVDVALASRADGVQLGEGGLPPEAARKVAGENLIVGRSVHSVESALAAEGEGADFLVVGTIFPTGTHPGAEPEGPRLLSRIMDRVSIPFAGIGGISAANVGEVMGAGSSGAAVISTILAAEDTEQAARDLKSAIDRAWSRRSTGVTGRRS